MDYELALITCFLQHIEQRLRFHEVWHVEAFSEPAVARRKEIAGFGVFALFSPESGKVG
jgi:hypothetical protein